MNTNARTISFLAAAPTPTFRAPTYFQGRPNTVYLRRYGRRPALAG